MAQRSGVRKREDPSTTCPLQEQRCCRYLCPAGAAASLAQRRLRRLRRVPRAAVTGTRSWRAREDHPQFQTISQAISESQSPSPLFHPGAQTRVTLTPHFEAGEEPYTLSQG